VRLITRHVTLVPVLAAAIGLFPATVGSARPERSAPLTAVSRAVRVACPAPRTLRLRRFEDGSAQLLCRGRAIVRVSVPR
jgi:hypothetical protein